MCMVARKVDHYHYNYYVVFLSTYCESSTMQFKVIMLPPVIIQVKMIGVIISLQGQ